MKKLIVIFASFISLFLLIPNVLAQSKEDLAQKYGVSFPIKELGNCVNISSCESFCDREENQKACIAYAKAKGFYQQPAKEQEAAKSDEEILKLAQKELGCSTYDACMDFCDQKTNWSKCAEFARSHGMGDEIEGMQQAMSTLGCNSPSECMSFCSNPINMPRCMEVFKQAGFEVDAGNYEPVENWCPKQGSGCKVEGDECVCPYDPAECAKLGPEYKVIDGVCVSESVVSSQSSEEWCQQDGGRWDGAVCWVGDSETIGDWCPKQGKNCRVEGNDCFCGPKYQEESIDSWCPKAGADCKVENGQCVCGGSAGSNPEYPNESIESWCPKAGPDCRIEDGTCVCGPVYDTPTYETPSYSESVQGATSTHGPLQLIWEKIKLLLKL